MANFVDWTSLNVVIDMYMSKLNLNMTYFKEVCWNFMSLFLLPKNTFLRLSRISVSELHVGM